MELIHLGEEAPTEEGDVAEAPAAQAVTGAAPAPPDPAAALDAYAEEIRGVRTIESAPKDGPPTLLYSWPLKRWTVGAWSRYGRHWINESGVIENVTHWQALPPATRGCNASTI